jgi:Ca-activated chloride channel family protein
MEEVRRAYREAALHLHPDKNVSPGETELFLSVNKAYEVLSDPELRKEYDQLLSETEAVMAEKASFSVSIQQSRQHLLQMDEPQVHYILVDITPSSALPDLRPPINISLVIDRSTSMRGQRLDQVRSAALSLLQELGEDDSASVVAFSDRAEVIVSPDQAKDFSVARARLSLLQAGGGTEIGQGLEAGLDLLRRNFTREGVNHLLLLTDGRTYGDEELCLKLAGEASDKGITIHGAGIGSDWSDLLLDDLASQTGGSVMFLDSPNAITSMLKNIVESLSKVIASRVHLKGSMAQEVDLRSAFRLLPEPMPMGDRLPINLGNLPKETMIRLLLEVVIHPLSPMEELTLAHFTVDGDLLGQNVESIPLPVEVKLKVGQDPDIGPPPEEIVSSLSLIALYRMQEKARHEAELGQSTQAAKRLENLGTQLLAAGERQLAKAALNEAERLTHARRISTEGEKVLKYGTRALLLPAKTGDT